MHSTKVLLGDASHFCILFTYCEGLKLKCDRYSSLAFNFRNNSANRLTLKVSLVPKQYSNLTCDKRCMKPSQSCSCVHENVNVKNMHMDLTIDGMPCQNWSCFQVIFYFEAHASCKAVLKTAGLEMGRTQHKAYWLIGSPKSTRCRWTNLIHWALHFGSVGNRCIVMPGV